MNYEQSEILKELERNKEQAHDEMMMYRNREDKNYWYSRGVYETYLKIIVLIKTGKS